MNPTRRTLVVAAVLIGLTGTAVGCGDSGPDTNTAYLAALDEQDWIRHFNSPTAATDFRTEYCNGEARAYGYPGINPDLFEDVATSIDRLTARFC